MKGKTEGVSLYNLGDFQVGDFFRTDSWGFPLNVTRADVYVGYDPALIILPHD
jgi:hypothetical protein